MNEKDAEMLEEAMPLFNIGDSEMRKALADFESNEGIEVDKSRNTGMNGDDEREFSSHHQNSEGYRSKWSSSKIEGRTTYYDDDGDDCNGDDCNGDENENEIDDHDIGSAASATDISVIDFDDLPDFADEECRELSREIKILERKRDDAAKNTKEHRDRVSLMKGHLNNVRQEIVHTNGLLAAKQKEIDTEKHLIALADREKAAVLAEIQDADEAIKDEKEKIRSLQIQIYVANEGLDKLKLSLNWNQVELEQWATAAAKKESDNLALEKFQRADEVKIKDLTLKLEHLTKLSAEKQAELENEKTETQSKQLEIDRVTKLFKANHEERRQLVEQWQKTVNAMKERDEEIDQVSVKYKDVTKILDVQLRDISVKRDEIFDMKAQMEELNKSVEASNRLAQNKRQGRIDEHEILRSIQVEVNVLKAESIASSQSLQKAKTESKAAANEVSEKLKQLELFQNHVEEIKRQLGSEKDLILSKDKISQNAEDRLNAREKEMKLMEKRNEDLRKRLYQESQHMAKLREKESNLIAEIKSTQGTVKNLTSKLNQLEKERAKQQELSYNADFKLQQVERKVARGLGERTDEEKEKLLTRMKELEEEQNAKRERNKYLIQQYKILKQELKKWNRKYGQCDSTKLDLQRKIDEVELEIVSCELNLLKLSTEKEEEMVSLDLVRLEVRRLRDILNKKTGEVYELEDLGNELSTRMKEKKHQVCLEAEVWTAQLRAADEERHRCKIELGQRSIVAEKIQMKYEMITTAHNTGNSDEGEGHSHVYYLIAAAQKRADLQREGDQLDAAIRKKEKETRAMKKTLSHLKERNTDFRHSFAKINSNGAEYQGVVAFEEGLQATEKEFFKAKKTMHDTQRIYENEIRDLKNIESQRREINKGNEVLEKKKKTIRCDLDELTNKVSSTIKTIEEERNTHKIRDYPHLKFGRNELSIQELSFQADLKELHLSHIVKMLMEIGREFPDTKNSIIASLTSEGIDIQC